MRLANLAVLRGEDLNSEADSGKPWSLIARIEKEKAKLEGQLHTFRAALTALDVSSRRRQTERVRNVGIRTALVPLYDRGTALKKDRGRKFFKTTRQRLTFDEYKEFLGYIKRYNRGTISAESAIQGSQWIFGEKNEDLYKEFVSLLN